MARYDPDYLLHAGGCGFCVHFERWVLVPFELLDCRDLLKGANLPHKRRGQVGKDEGDYLLFVN